MPDDLILNKASSIERLHERQSGEQLHPTGRYCSEPASRLRDLHRSEETLICPDVSRATRNRSRLIKKRMVAGTQTARVRSPLVTHPSAAMASRGTAFGSVGAGPVR